MKLSSSYGNFMQRRHAVRLGRRYISAALQDVYIKLYNEHLNIELA